MTPSRPKTTTFASGLRALTGVAAVTLAAAAIAAGCGGIDCPEGSSAMPVTEVQCAAQGGVQVASPTLAVPATAVPGGGATTCMQVDATCGGESVIVFASAGQSADGYIHFGLRIPAVDAPGTYPLAGDTTRFGSALVSDGVSYTGDLTVTSGALVIARNTAMNLDAAFSVELQTTDGLHQVSLTGGSIHVGSCRVAHTARCFAAD